MTQEVHYMLEGMISIPDDWTVEDSCLTLPDGRSIKLWEAFELYDPEKDAHTDQTFDQMEKLGCFYDGSSGQFTHVRDA